jgi:hypothetical protein
MNCIICCQTVKSIPKDIKRNLSDLVVFPGISEIDFKELVKESTLGCFDMEEAWRCYRSLPSKHSMMTFHVAARKIDVKYA